MAPSRLFSVFKKNSSSRQFFNDVIYWPWILLNCLPVVIFFNSHVGELTTITGQSMFPYFNSDFHESLQKNHVWARKWKPTEGLKRGMIVSFWSPFHPEVQSTKRVIALEGDTVFTRAPCPVHKVVVPRGHVWVEGDNLDVYKTLDSNTYGPIPLNLINGRLTRIVWPWKSAGTIKWEEFRGRTRVVRGREEDAPHWDNV